MPSIAAHMVCAKLVAEELKINDVEFIKGNLLPDITSKENSHNKIIGKYYLIPDIDYFVNTLNLKDNLSLGYLSHLLLDKFYLQDYIYDAVLGDNVFISKIIYKEYDIINYRLLMAFNIDVNYLNNILKYVKGQVDEEKYEANIKCLNNVSTEEESRYLNVINFSEFLVRTSKLIADYLREVME